MSAQGFAGTFGVFVPLPEIGAKSDHFLEDHVPLQDQCRDPLVFGGRCLEDDPHITLHMGLPEDIDKVMEATKDIKPFKITITGAGFFRSSQVFVEDSQKHEWDVLWRDFKDESGSIQKIHENLVKLFDKPWHRSEGYTPHITVCYLTHNTAEKYVELLKQGHEWTIIVDRLVVRKFKDSSYLPVHIDLTRN